MHKELRDRFVELLVEKTKKIKVGNPLDRDVWLGPVINEAAVKTFEDAVARAVRDGGRVLTGGKRITTAPLNHGYFVEPTVIDGLPVRPSRLCRGVLRSHRRRCAGAHAR